MNEYLHLCLMVHLTSCLYCKPLKHLVHGVGTLLFTLGGYLMQTCVGLFKMGGSTQMIKH